MESSIRKSLTNFLARISFVFLEMVTLAIAISFLMYGIAICMGRIFGDKLWLGFVFTGTTFILGKLLVSKIILLRARKKARQHETIDIIKWIQKYPFYSTGIAATTGFVMSGGTASQTFKNIILPLIKEYLVPLSEQKKVMEQEKNIREGQEKMDAEGGNQGKAFNTDSDTLLNVSL